MALLAGWLAAGSRAFPMPRTKQTAAPRGSFRLTPQAKKALRLITNTLELSSTNDAVLYSLKLAEQLILAAKDGAEVVLERGDERTRLQLVGIPTQEHTSPRAERRRRKG
jgi:hypothetical protein